MTAEIPIVRVGTGSPELWIIAGVHGDEVEGIACVEEALACLTPSRGTLVGVPVAYAEALAAGTRLGPDGLDLNRSCPGRPEGRLTERTAHALCASLRRSADALVTLHSWGRSGCVVPYVEHASGDERSRKLAHKLGLPFVEPCQWPNGLLPWCIARTGIPAVEIELGGLGQQTRGNLQLGLRAIACALAVLGMVDHAADEQTPPLAVQRRRLTTPVAGRVRQLRALGEEISGGQPVCELRAHDGTVLETLPSPASGWVAAHDTYGHADVGDPVTVIFELGAAT